MDSTLRPDLSVLVDLALCSSKEPANSLWINMQDYGMSKGSPLWAPKAPGASGPHLTVCSVADWDNASLSNESLLDTVSRFVLAALLKHTGLLHQASGEGRYRHMSDVFRALCVVPQGQDAANASWLKGVFISPSGTNPRRPWRMSTAVSIRSGTACWPVRTWTSSRPGPLPGRGG